MITSIIYFIIFVLSTNVCIGKRYYNYTMYRAIPVNSTHIDFLSNMNDFYDINFWRPPGMIFKPVDFVVNPIHQPSFLRAAERHGIYLTTIIKDVQQAFDRQTVKSYIRRDMSSFDWTDFFRLDDIYHWLRDLAQANPKVMKLFTIGKSYENRDIMAVRIALREKKHLRSTVIVEGGIHAREWIAPSVVTYLIHQILHADTSGNKALNEIATTYEWYFVPVLNVDGYEYTHTEDRLWRKNRNGEGVDLNRNFGHAFGTAGVSRTPKSDLYCGEKAFSEKESRAMADFVKSKSQGLEFYVAFHSYGQYMILPYANLKKHFENYEDIVELCTKVAQKIAVRHGTKYRIGTAYDTVGYLSSGVSGCWVKATFKTPYVVTFELRDNGQDGFALGIEKILPTCQETLDGLVTLFKPQTNRPLNALNKAVCVSASIVTTFNMLLLIAAL